MRYQFSPNAFPWFLLCLAVLALVFNLSTQGGGGIAYNSGDFAQKEHERVKPLLEELDRQFDVISDERQLRRAAEERVAELEELLAAHGITVP